MRVEDYINKFLYLELKIFLHGLLVVEDKISMVYLLEICVLFLDNDLVDFVLKMFVCLKLVSFGDVVRFNENELGFKIEKYFN